MNKHIENIKKSYKDELMKGGLVILAAVSGVASAGVLRKLTEGSPTLSTIVTYGYPVLLGGGGFLLTTATEKDSKAKYIGYGLEAAAVIEGVKLIPVAGDYLKGVLGDTEIPAATAFLTESDERQKIMSGFGLSALPIGSTALSESPGYDTRLPDLEGMTDTMPDKDLGYNGSATDDVDNINGIL